jgi:hypothetical protein
MTISNAMSCLLVLSLIAASTAAQDEGPSKKKPASKTPQPKFFVPPAVPTGFAGKLRIRGQNLKDATEVTTTAEGVELKFLKAETVGVPVDLDTVKLGDTAVEFEIKLPAELTPGEIPFVIKTPQGEATLPLLVLDKLRFTILQEDAGDGFRAATPLELGQTIAGAIEQSRDVDVFALKLKAGRPFVAETLSARRGSPCDPHLTLFDERGRTMKSNDDHAGTRDARLEFTPPADGLYYLSLLEAHDRGQESFRYLLHVEQK